LFDAGEKSVHVYVDYLAHGFAKLTYLRMIKFFSILKITEAVMARRSVRTYNGKPLDEATARDITRFIAGLQAPFGAGCRIELVRTAAATATASARPVRLGTYGAIRGATDYLALIVRGDGPLAQEGAAYMFEQAVLHCTSLGLGTCWLAGFFDRGGFKKELSLGPGERLRSVSPVGYAAQKPHRSISTLAVGTKPTTRKPFGETFFDGVFGEPLTEEAAGVWALPLEMVRRAPSANNKQSWRVVLAPDKAALHFYQTPSMGYERLDGGIALCHFAETCREEGISGRFETLPGAPAAPKGQKALYVMSWIIE
jgi:nitroreductase